MIHRIFPHHKFDIRAKNKGSGLRSLNVGTPTVITRMVAENGFCQVNPEPDRGAKVLLLCLKGA
jgi:hypothetical protein